MENLIKKSAKNSINLKIIKQNIQEIIKNLTNKIEQALAKLAKEYTNSVNDTNHLHRNLLGELHNELSKLLELANSDYKDEI